MKRIKKFLARNMNNIIATFALFFAINSSRGICIFIFHQPKMPDELRKIEKK